MTSGPASSDPVAFRHYQAADHAACLDIFDANCPRFFAPNERQDFDTYLTGKPDNYQVATRNNTVVGAFGVSAGTTHDARINWIMIDPSCQGDGVGAQMMLEAIGIARQLEALRIHIAASQHSAAFFAKYGATEVARTTDGWGPGMHRLDMLLELSAAGA